MTCFCDLKLHHSYNFCTNNFFQKRIDFKKCKWKNFSPTNLYLPYRIFVDWSAGSQTINYISAANRVETVGFFVASQLNFMRDYGFADFNRLHVIGFSLGEFDIFCKSF